MDWKDYEQVTRKVYEALGAQVGVKVVGYGNAFKVKGHTGIDHQIDVLTSHFDGIHQYLTDIECKHWDKKINKDILMKVQEIVEDCNFSKGVVVSTLGFTPDAVAYAKYRGIGLVILREPTEEDWKGRVRTVVVNIHPHFPEITKLEHQVTEVFQNKEGPVLVDEYHYVHPDGSQKELSTIVQEFQTQLTFDKVGKETEYHVDFPDGTELTDSDGMKVANVRGVTIVGTLKAGTPQTIEINGQDKVWLIMKSIFEEKTFLISHKGEIRDIS